MRCQGAACGAFWYNAGAVSLLVFGICNAGTAPVLFYVSELKPGEENSDMEEFVR